MINKVSFRFPLLRSEKIIVSALCVHWLHRTKKLSVKLRFTSRSRILHPHGDVTIADERLQNLGLCSALRAFQQGGIFIVPHLLWHMTSILKKKRPLQLVASCDKQGMLRTYSNQDPHGSNNRCNWTKKETHLLKGIVSKLTIKFWMCEKCGKMKDYN
jgi:hypothetical protein